MGLLDPLVPDQQGARIGLAQNLVGVDVVAFALVAEPLDGLVDQEAQVAVILAEHSEEPRVAPFG